MKTRNLRDYGLPDPEVTGTPTWKRVEGELNVCPNCGAQLCEVQVPVKMKMLKGGKGTCRYLGCPACPYASPSINVADGETP